MSDTITITQAELDKKIEEAANKAAAAAAARAKAEVSKGTEAEQEKAIAEAKAAAIKEYEAANEKKASVQKVFIANGGTPEAFNDFYNTVGEKIRTDNDNTIKADINTLKAEKAYMFGATIKPEAPEAGKEDDKDEFYPGTLQRKN